MQVTPSEATGLVGLLAFVAAALGVRLRWRADQRDAWWQRAQWAIDKSLDEDRERRMIGSEAMFVLAEDPGAAPIDLKVLDAALSRSLPSDAAAADDPS